MIQIYSTPECQLQKVPLNIFNQLQEGYIDYLHIAFFTTSKFLMN